MWWSQWESDTIKHKDKYDASSTEEWKVFIAQEEKVKNI